MNKEFVEVKSFGEVFPKTTPNNRVPYEHQKMQCTIWIL